jgi:hypothetical protein
VTTTGITIRIIAMACPTAIAAAATNTASISIMPTRGSARPSPAGSTGRRAPVTCGAPDASRAPPIANVKTANARTGSARIAKRRTAGTRDIRDRGRGLSGVERGRQVNREAERGRRYNRPAHANYHRAAYHPHTAQHHGGGGGGHRR